MVLEILPAAFALMTWFSLRPVLFFCCEDLSPLLGFDEICVQMTKMARCILFYIYVGRNVWKLFHVFNQKFLSAILVSVFPPVDRF